MTKTGGRAAGSPGKIPRAMNEVPRFQPLLCVTCAREMLRERRGRLTTLQFCAGGEHRLRPDCPDHPGNLSHSPNGRIFYCSRVTGKDSRGRAITCNTRFTAVTYDERGNPVRERIIPTIRPRQDPMNPKEERVTEYKLSDDARERALDWMMNGQVGKSSLEIVRTALTGETGQHPRYPLDPADLRLCLLLLERVPEAACAMPLLSEASETWKGLAREWKRLESLLREETGDIRNPKASKAPRTYQAMLKIRHPEEE